MPTTTTGLATSFINFSRPGASGGGATTTDRDGKIKWAGHNLLPASEQFDSSAWSKAGVSVTANTYAAPDGATTADTLVFSAGNNVIYRDNLTIPSAFVIGCWVRSTTGTATFRFTYYNGSTSLYSSDFTATTSWQFFSATFTGSGVVGNAGISTASGLGATTIVAWGAHLYRSDLGGMQLNPAMPAGMQSYYPTTPRNLLGFTKDFSGTGWTRINLLAYGSGSVANAAVAPNGLQTADLLVESTANGYHSVYRSFTCISGTPYVWAAYVKPAGRTIVQIAAQATGNTHIVEFNLTGAGTATTRSGSGTAAITALSDGWYRISTIATATASGTGYWQVDMCSAANTNSYTGDGTSGIYLWGAQLSDSASLDTYVPVYGAAVTSAAYYAPRLDFDGATLAAKGLLVEELRTNIVLHSNEFDNAAWTKTLLNTTGTPAWVNAAVSPDGTQNADFLIPTTDNNYHSARQTVTVANTTYTFSCCVKANGYNFVVLQLADSNAFGKFYEGVFNLSNGTIENTGRAVTYTGARNTPVSLGNGWYRVSITVNSIDANSTTIVQVLPYNTNDPTSPFAGNGTSGVLVYGAQLEVGASNAAAPFMTSLIPTGSATATRAADVASVSTQAFPYSASEGTIVVSYDRVGIKLYSRLFNLGDATENNQVSVLNYNSNQENTLLQTAGVQTVIAGPTIPAANIIAKAGLAFKTGDSAFSLNGSSATAISTSLTLAATSLAIGSSQASGQQINGHIRQITYLPRRISNAELQSRTA